MPVPAVGPPKLLPTTAIVEPSSLIFTRYQLSWIAAPPTTTGSGDQLMPPSSERHKSPLWSADTTVRPSAELSMPRHHATTGVDVAATWPVTQDAPPLDVA